MASQSTFRPWKQANLRSIVDQNLLNNEIGSTAVRFEGPHVASITAPQSVAVPLGGGTELSGGIRGANWLVNQGGGDPVDATVAPAGALATHINDPGSR